jgi:hypothetical protein
LLSYITERKEVIMMKRTIIAGIAALLVLGVVASASAFGPGYGRFGCGLSQGYPGAYTQEQAQNVERFRAESAPLIERMFQLKSELWTLRNEQSPDWNAISAKQREMFDLRMQVQQRAVDAGIAGYAAGQCGFGRGMGRNMAW